MAYADFTGTLLAEPVLEEGKFLLKWLELTMQGASKPNSPLYELQKIQRAIDSTTDIDKKRDLVNLKANQLSCCPPSTTVNDSLEYKDTREAIQRRLLDITGLKQYFRNER